MGPPKRASVLVCTNGESEKVRLHLWCLLARSRAQGTYSQCLCLYCKWAAKPLESLHTESSRPEPTVKSAHKRCLAQMTGARAQYKILRCYASIAPHVHAQNPITLRSRIRCKNPRPVCLPIALYGYNRAFADGRGLLLVLVLVLVLRVRSPGRDSGLWIQEAGRGAVEVRSELNHLPVHRLLELPLDVQHHLALWAEALHLVQLWPLSAKLGRLRSRLGVSAPSGIYGEGEQLPGVRDNGAQLTRQLEELTRGVRYQTVKVQAGHVARAELLRDLLLMALEQLPKAGHVDLDVL
mmetsp:Transcript_19772/g.54350  ORF Transcript_19772/g.54350 Transcript_19772/m.54350 type:complete len:295 (-) Transcript_19772:666-1550(-)